MKFGKPRRAQRGAFPERLLSVQERHDEYIDALDMEVFSHSAMFKTVAEPFCATRVLPSAIRVGPPASLDITYLPDAGDRYAERHSSLVLAIFLLKGG